RRSDISLTSAQNEDKGTRLLSIALDERRAPFRSLLEMENRAMSLFHTHEKCSRCNISLALWNASTCTRCGRKLCSHHTHLMRVPHSYVLASICDNCSGGAATMLLSARLASQQPTQVAQG